MVAKRKQVGGGHAPTRSSSATEDSKEAWRGVLQSCRPSQRECNVTILLKSSGGQEAAAARFLGDMMVVIGREDVANVIVRGHGEGEEAAASAM
jgi:hypothetical protein